MRRAHALSSFFALVGLPAAILLIAFASWLVPSLAWIFLAASTGALCGFAWQIGGGLTSNVRQPLWIGLVTGPLCTTGSLVVVTSGASSLHAMPRIALAGFLFLGALPGLVLYAVLAKLFGVPSVTREAWTSLPK